MRILQLIDTLDPGGAERMAVNMANTFHEMQIPNCLVVSRSQGQLGSLIIVQNSVSILGKRNTLDLKAFWKLRAIVNKFRPDIIHAHSTSIYWAVGLKFIFSKAKLIWHDHLGISEDVIKNNPRHELKWMAPWIDLVITANESTADFWVDQKLKSADKIQYLANFPYLKVKKKVKTDVFTFLHLANFRSEKGQKTLILASKRLFDTGLKFKARLVGKKVDIDWWEACSQMISELGLATHVFLEEARADVDQLMAEVDAGLVASDREGLPVALLEYGLAGLPVISTNVGQCPTVLEKGKYGELVNPGDAIGLADAMEKLIANPQTAKESGQRFQSHINESYGASFFIEKYADILERNFHQKLTQN